MDVAEQPLPKIPFNEVANLMPLQARLEGGVNDACGRCLCCDEPLSYRAKPTVGPGNVGEYAFVSS